MEAVAALDRHNVLDHAVCAGLANGYTFLRKLEHRCQLLSDQQTHALPTEPEDLKTVAHLMGYDQTSKLLGALAGHQRTLATLYSTYLHQNPDSKPSEAVRARLGPAGVSWFESLPLGDGFFSSLTENESSLARVEQILRCAPALVARFKRSVPLTELLLSGEIEEKFDGVAALENLPLDTPLDKLAETFNSLYTKAVAQWVFGPDDSLGPTLTDLADALVRHVSRRLYLDVDLLALGSYARKELAPDSDVDLVCLVNDPRKQPAAEAGVQGFIALLGKLRRLDVPIEVDLRLRPGWRKRECSCVPLRH